MLSPHPEKWGDASPPRPPPIDARECGYDKLYNNEDHDDYEDNK